jgi:hypothetical protein
MQINPSTQRDPAGIRYFSDLLFVLDIIISQKLIPLKKKESGMVIGEEEMRMVNSYTM